MRRRIWSDDDVKSLGVFRQRLRTGLTGGTLGGAISVYVRFLVVLFAVVGIVLLALVQFQFLSLTRIEKQPRESSSSDVVTMTGYHLLTSDYVPVDTDGEYEITLEVRVLPGPGDATRTSRLFLALRCLGEDSEILYDGDIMAVRYAGANDRILYSSRGWTTIRGTIGGVGKSNTTFAPGTKSVAIWALPNFETEDSTVEIRNVKFTRMVSLSKT